MKINEILKESMDEYDSILHGLLKIVNQKDTKGEKPLGRKAVKFRGKWIPGGDTEETINTMLHKLGVKAWLNASSTATSGYEEMAKGLSNFIRSMTPGEDEKRYPEFNREDIAELAKTIYDWSTASIARMKKDPYYSIRMKE